MAQHCDIGVSYPHWVIINRKNRIFIHNFCKIAYKSVIKISKIVVKISGDIANICFVVIFQHNLLRFYENYHYLLHHLLVICIKFPYVL